MVPPLATELQRVATAPYAVSLKTLHDLLTAPSPAAIISFSITESIHLWATSHACLLPSLACSVVTSLEFCPFAQRVLEILAKERGIRDAILKHKRSFLEGVLKSAMSTDRYFYKYSPLTLSFLHHPLPQTVPVPALLGPFFLRCVESATTSPTPEAIRNIYILVSSGYAYLSSFLTKEQKSMLHGRLGKFLHEAEQGVVLAALATLAHFHLEDERVGGARGDVSKELFSGKNSQKLLNLVCINVITAASGNVGANEDWEERLEQVRYANVILEAVADGSREAYVKSSGATKALENLMRKMEKLLAEGKTRFLRVILRFCIKLSPGRAIPGLVEFVAKMLRRSLDDEAQGRGMVILEESLAELLRKSYPDLTVHEIIKAAITISSMPLPLESTSFCRLEDQISFLNALTIRIPFSADLRKAILSCLHTNDLAVPIKTFINQSLQSIRGSRAQDCIQIDVCPVILFNKQKELASVICVMVLTAEMHSTVDDIERLQPKTATQFLELHGKLSAALVDSRCSVESNSSSHQGGSAPLTILEATATPGMRMSSQHWRDRLLNELCQDAHRQHAGIISAVGEICRDLERRCEDIEKPLKDEQARSQALQKEIEDAQGKHRMLEELLERKQSQIEEMEHEKETLEAQLDAALEKVHESEEKIGTLRKDVEDERKGRKDDWKLAAIERDRVAGEHLGAMAESQTRIDELEGSVSKLTEIAEGLRVELDNEKREKGHLAAELENKIRELEEKQKEVGQRNEELEELGKGIEEKLILIQEKDAFIGSMTAKITGLEKAIDESKETIAARDSVIAEKQTVVEQMGGEVKRLEDAALAKDRDIHELNQRLVRLDEAVAEFRAKTEQLRLEIEQTKASSRLQVEHLQKDHTNTVNGLKNAHEKELLTVQAQLQKTKHDWISDRESLYGEIRGWEKKFEKYQAIQERKAKEFSDAQELARKLMATMGAVNYNELIPTGSPARPARESIPVPASLRTPTRKSARRRRADALEEHQPENDMNPNSPSSPVIEPSAKRTRTKLHSVKATNTAPILENKQSTTGFKTVKSSVFHTKAVGSNYNKENMTPRAGKASKFADVRDEGSELNTRVPDDVEDSNDNGVEAGDGSEAGDTITSSSSYGETVIFTSTPKILAGNINAGVAAAHPESVDSSMEGQHYEPDDTTGGF